MSTLAIEPCCVKIIDKENGWPVPLVELRTTHDMRFVSDNAGLIAFDAPELMSNEVWFTVIGHGYTVPKDGFGYRGIKLIPESGKKLTVKVARKVPGKRLGRITGSGLFAESRKLGLHMDWQGQGIAGCDTIRLSQYNNSIFWTWGDTKITRYPLGHFHIIGASTPLKPLNSFEPPIKLRYSYFTGKDDKQRVIAQMPGDGPTWITGLVSLPDKNNKQRLVSVYRKIENHIVPYEVGLCEWNAEKEAFEQLKVLWNKSEGTDHPSLIPAGHPVFIKDKSGKELVLFGDPFPALQCDATYESWKDPANWKKITPQKSVKSHKGDNSIIPHRGSIAWNDYRNKWVAIFTQKNGKPSKLGEIWYAESNCPTGPWKNAVKVVTHNHYTFYNPRIHADFTTPESPILLFEGTYTKEFSRTKEPTPRHNYNQILYRIDLDEDEFKF